jgi:sugar phosphate isomerase/epimerase
VCVPHDDFNLHHWLYSFQRLRQVVGPVVGVNLDPSHFFYQSMDAIEVIKTLGDAIYYVHAKDARVDPRNTALYGALDMRFPLPPRDMTWVYRTVGYGHETTGQIS